MKYIITAHPFKTPLLMYYVHQFYLEIDIKEHKKEKIRLLQRYKAVRNITKTLSQKLTQKLTQR